MTKRTEGLVVPAGLEDGGLRERLHELVLRWGATIRLPFMIDGPLNTSGLGTLDDRAFVEQANRLFGGRGIVCTVRRSLAGEEGGSYLVLCPIEQLPLLSTKYPVAGSS